MNIQIWLRSQVFLMSNKQEVKGIIHSGNSLASNNWQVIAWTNDNQVHWHTYVSQSLIGLMCQLVCKLWCQLTHLPLVLHMCVS